MGSSAIKGLAFASESSFGVDPASGYERVNFANNIQFSATVGGVEFQCLKDEHWTEKLVRTSKSSATLSFSVQAYGFLTNGATYTGPTEHQLSTLMAHCMGGQFYQAEAQVTGTNNASTTQTKILASTFMSDAAIPAIFGFTAAGSNQLEPRFVISRTASGAGHYGSIIGHWLDSSGVAAQATGINATFKTNNIYLNGGATFPSSLAFEVFGDDEEDSYRLLGCCGTFSFSVTAGGAPVFNFSFQVADWSRIDHSACNYDFDANRWQDNESSVMVINGAGRCSWFLYSNETTIADYGTIDLVSASVDLGQTITRRIGVGADNGTANWIKTAISPTMSITTYFQDELHDVFDTTTFALPMYIRFGRATGRFLSIFLQNAVMVEQPSVVDQGGITAHNATFRAGHDKITQSGSSVVKNADLVFAFH